MLSINDLLANFGARELFQILKDGTPRTRSELTKLTGISRVTVSARIDELLDYGLICGYADAVSTGGRPPSRVVLNPQARLVAAADFGATHAAAALVNLAGDVLVQISEQRDISSGPVSSLDWFTTSITSMLETVGKSSDTLIGMGLGVPGPVEHSTGVPSNPPIMPGWDGFDIPGYLQQTFPIPVAVDNDVNIMALGEQVKGWPDTRNLILVKISTGIGSGIISGGQLQRGQEGSAGDVGHIAIPEAIGIQCRCGNMACIEALAGAPAIINKLQSQGLKISTTAELIESFRDGELMTINALREAGRHVGQVLSMFVSILNPAVIVIAGSLSEASELLIAGMREVVYGRSTPLATKHLVIAPSKVGQVAALTGAGIMAIENTLTNGDSAHDSPKP